MSASLGSPYFVAAPSATALCAEPQGNGLVSTKPGAHGVAVSTFTWSGSSVNDLTTSCGPPSTHTGTILLGNPKTLLTRFCLPRGGVRITFRSSGVLAPYWSKKAASLTNSVQSTTGWGGGGVPKGRAGVLPATGTSMAAPSSRLASLPVGGGWGLLVSLGVDGPTPPEHVIDGGAPWRSRRNRPRGDVPGPIVYNCYDHPTISIEPDTPIGC